MSLVRGSTGGRQTGLEEAVVDASLAGAKRGDRIGPTAAAMRATNPESGMVTYTYDGNRNVLTKKDALGITTAYTSEALNRENWKRYRDGTTLTAGFGYDGNDATGNPICLSCPAR